MRITVKRSPATVALALSIVVAAGSIAVAAIPSGDGSVTACINATGNVRFVDAPRIGCLPAERLIRLASFDGPAGGDLTGRNPNPTIAPGAVTSAKIAGNAITAQKIATSAVGQTELAVGAVTSGAIKDGTVGQQDLDYPALRSALLGGLNTYRRDSGEIHYRWDKDIDDGRLEEESIRCRQGDIAIGGRHFLLGGGTVSRVVSSGTINNGYQVSVEFFDHAFQEHRSSDGFGGDAEEDVVTTRLSLSVECLDVTP